MAQVSRRLGQGLFALGVLVLVQPAPNAGAVSAARDVTVVGSAAGPRPVTAHGRPAASGRTAARERTPAAGRAAAPSGTPPSGRRSPPPGRLPEPASNRAYGLPVALSIVAAGGVLSLLVRVLIAEGPPSQRAGCGPDRSAD